MLTKSQVVIDYCKEHNIPVVDIKMEEITDEQLINALIYSIPKECKVFNEKVCGSHIGSFCSTQQSTLCCFLCGKYRDCNSPNVCNYIVTGGRRIWKKLKLN